MTQFGKAFLFFALYYQSLLHLAAYIDDRCISKFYRFKHMQLIIAILCGTLMLPIFEYMMWE